MEMGLLSSVSQAIVQSKNDFKNWTHLAFSRKRNLGVLLYLEKNSHSHCICPTV